MRRTPSFVVSTLLASLALTGYAEERKGLNAVNVKLAIARAGGSSVDSLSDADLESLLAEASTRAGYGGTIPEGFDDAMARVYDIAVEILQERTVAAGTTNFYGHIKGGNGEVLATSETYERNVASDSGGRYYPVNRVADPGAGSDGRWKAPALDSKGRTDRVFHTRDGEFHFSGVAAAKVVLGGIKTSEESFRAELENTIYVLDLSGSMSWDTRSYTGLDGSTQYGSRLDRAKVELIRSVSAAPDGGNPPLDPDYATFERNLFDLSLLLSEGGADPGPLFYSTKLHMVTGGRLASGFYAEDTRTESEYAGIMAAPGAEGRTFGDEVWNQPLRGIGAVVDGSVAVLVIEIVPADAKATPWKHHNIQGLDSPTLEFTSGESSRLDAGAGGDGGPAESAENHNSSRSNKSYPLAFVLGGGDGDSGPAESAENHNSSRSNKSYPLAFVLGGGDGDSGPAESAENHNSSRSNKSYPLAFVLGGGDGGPDTVGIWGYGPEGTTFSGPPRIFLLLPTQGPEFMPVGSGNIVVEYFGQMSNPFPFTKN